MGERSVIEWTDATVNFWRGCSKVDPTCAECYMFRDQRRYGRDPSVVVRCSDSVFYAAQRSKKWRERRERIEAEQGRRMRIFTCSWSDFFHEDVPARDLADAWAVIRECPEYDWQILTSRPERIAGSLPDDWGSGWPHVWMGATIGTRKFVHRADILRATPAAVRFISAEPLLGPLLPDYYDETRRTPAGGDAWWGDPPYWSDGKLHPALDLTDIDWLIVGGESAGKPYRRLIDENREPVPHKLGWVRDLRDATRATTEPCECCRTTGSFGGGRCEACGGRGRIGGGTAFLFKQWGGPRPDSGGRLLDGRTWDEFPISPAAVLA